MKVFINQQEIIIFAGARIKDALIAYSSVTWHKVTEGNITILDRFGNPTDPDGPMLEGQHFILKESDKNENK